MRLLPPHVLAVVCWQDGDGGEGVGRDVLVMVSGGDGPGPGVDGEHGGRAVAVAAGAEVDWAHLELGSLVIHRVRFFGNPR